MKKKRVVVGMSGGVDSSVTAALLKQRGYEVIGISLQLLPKEEEKRSACCNLTAIGDAKRVASKIGIPHYTVNTRDVFKDKVIDHFVDQYLNGFTPNPCVECNRSIKFDELLSKAKDLNADYIATGHYCKRTFSPSKNRYYLKKAKDIHKDQSYFLYMLTSDQLSKILFPLGDFNKDEIRQMAKNFGFLNADKPDSQEICFVAGESYKSFIERYLTDNSKIKKGFFVDINGNVLGEHEGIHRYTIGQRRGLNLGTPTPMFVLKIDSKNHTVILGDKESLKKDVVTLNQLSLVNDEDYQIGKNYDFKFRYQMSPIKGKIIQKKDTSIDIELANRQSFISPGQSAVMYLKDKVIGGGIIN